MRSIIARCCGFGNSYLLGSTEVASKATQRRFMLAYKRKVLTLAAGLPAGETGALLRCEGLYSSPLTHWRQQLATLVAKTPEPRRGRKPDLSQPRGLRLDKLERELVRTRKWLVQAEAIIEAQKKLCALLGLPNSEESP